MKSNFLLITFGEIPVKNLFVLFFVPASWALVVGLSARQDASEGEFGEHEAEVRLHLEEVGEELHHELKNLEGVVEELKEVFAEARERGDREEAHFLELELAGRLKELDVLREVLARHEKVSATGGDVFLREEGGFFQALGRFHLHRQQIRNSAEIERVKYHLREAEGEEALLRRGRLERLKNERNKLNELLEASEKVEALLREGRHEEGHELERKMDMARRDLELGREMEELEHRIMGALEEKKHLLHAARRVEREALAVQEIAARQRKLIQAWGETRRKLADLEGEEFHHVLEGFEILRRGTNLEREMTELRLELAEAESHGHDEEAEELREVIKDLKLEAEELESEALER